jgi:hypothetical protein
MATPFASIVLFYLRLDTLQKGVVKASHPQRRRGVVE